MTAFGDCLVQQHADGSIDVIKADPRIKVAGQLVREWRANPPDPRVSIADDVFTIRAANRTVVYCLGEYEPLTDTYPAEWPD